jgi:hypothetical protein
MEILIGCGLLWWGLKIIEIEGDNKILKIIQGLLIPPVLLGSATLFLYGLYILINSMQNWAIPVRLVP